MAVIVLVENRGLRVSQSLVKRALSPQFCLTVCDAPSPFL
jgi:hypothetical protein